MPALRLLCLAAALVTCTGPSAAATAAAAGGPVVRCEPCDAGALLQCKPLPRECAEQVREPGCGCCVTCALEHGQACGVYTARCGSGLSCRQQPGETRPLQALLEGRGVCARKAPAPAPKQETPNPVEEINSNATSTSTELPGIRVFKCWYGRGVTDGRAPLQNKLIKKDQNRRTHSYKVETSLGGTNMDVHNFSLENTRETEYGPCRREMESILNSLKINNVLNPRGFRIPNCDRKGFYKKKQCRPSKGRRRGYCWCVDKYGQPLPGLNGRDRLETQCHRPDSQ